MDVVRRSVVCSVLLFSSNWDDTKYHVIFSGILPHDWEQVPNSSQVCHVGRFAFCQVRARASSLRNRSLLPDPTVGGALNSMLMLLHHFAFWLLLVILLWAPSVVQFHVAEFRFSRSPFTMMCHGFGIWPGAGLGRSRVWLWPVSDFAPPHGEVRVIGRGLIVERRRSPRGGVW